VIGRTARCGGARLGMRNTRTLPLVAPGRSARLLSQAATSSSKFDDPALLALA
jgi:hypothetical protein